MTNTNSLPAEELDRLFDEGEDITPYLDLASATRPGLEAKRVNVDFPAWMVTELDKEATRMGITRQALIKVVIHQHLQDRAS